MFDYSPEAVAFPVCYETAVYQNQSGDMAIVQVDPYGEDSLVVIPQQFALLFAEKVMAVANEMVDGD